METQKMSAAKQRWLLVKEVLKSSRNNLSQSKLSGRKFSGYSLFFKEIPTSVSAGQVGDEFSWRRFLLGPSGSESLDIRVYSDRITVEDLVGFNNTGNVCIWPSEDVLAHFLTSEKFPLSTFKRVCEIGGGMTSLAGLAAAVLVEFEEVLLTDGNEKSVSNINAIIDRNMPKFRAKKVNARRLRWDQLSDDDKNGEWSHHFDLIICADCLFFKESHASLLETILTMLTAGGLCCMLAPRRGDSLSCFIDLARSRSQGGDKNFEIRLTERYDEILWQKAAELSKNNSSPPGESNLTDYSPDQHYPLLLEIKKIS